MSLAKISVRKRKNIESKQIDAATLLLHLTQSSAIFYCKWDTSRRAKLTGIAIQKFCDVASHSEEHRSLDTLEPCNTINEHSSHRELTGIEDDRIEPTFSFHNFVDDICARR